MCVYEHVCACVYTCMSMDVQVCECARMSAWASSRLCPVCATRPGRGAAKAQVHAKLCAGRRGLVSIANASSGRFLRGISINPRSFPSGLALRRPTGRVPLGGPGASTPSLPPRSRCHWLGSRLHPARPACHESLVWAFTCRPCPSWPSPKKESLGGPPPAGLLLGMALHGSPLLALRNGLPAGEFTGEA